MRLALIKPYNAALHDGAVAPSLALAYLAAHARDAVDALDIYDAPKTNADNHALMARFRETPADVYGVTCYSNSFGVAKSLVRAIKAEQPGAFVVMGGPHATFAPEEVAGCSGIDAAVYAEGEEALPGLLRAIGGGDLSAVPNLVYRDETGIRRTPVRFIENLDTLRLPAWDLMRPETYPQAPHGLFTRKARVCPIVATRGCPYACTFCSAGTIMGKPIRKRSADSVIEELRVLRDGHGIEEFQIADDNFTLERAYATDMCERFLKDDIGMPWSLPNGVRLNTLDEDLVRLLERSGCYSMAVGIESGSDEILRRIKKGLRVRRIIEKTAMIKRVSNIRVVGFFMLGFPFETEEDIRTTLRFSRKLPIDAADYSVFVPFPGSDLYAVLKSRPELAEADWDELSHEAPPVLPPEGMTPRELDRWRRRAFRRFYIRPRIWFGLLRDLRTASQWRALASRVFRVFWGNRLTLRAAKPA